MPNDLITLKALAKELNDNLTDGRIDKIGMPSEDEVYLLIRARGVNRNLYLCARSNMPRVHFSTERIPNTAVPPTFCMLLRKYILGGIIESVKMLNEDRLMEITVVARNELNDATTFRLIIEIMGGASNIVLTSGDYQIIDAVKRVMNAESRTVFPKVAYTFPEKSKALLRDLESVKNAVEKGTVKDVYGAINGLSKESAQELIELTKSIGVLEATARLNDVYSSSAYSPVLEVDEKGVPIGFFAYPYLSRKGNFIKQELLSTAIENYYKSTAEKTKKTRDTLKINQKLKTLMTRTEKRIKENEETLNHAKDKERFKELGEILKCNIYRIEKGSSIIICDDFYNMGSVEIALDSTISPQKNVEKYFKRYNKAKGAENYAREELKRLKELKEYLLSIKVAVQNSSTEQEYKEISLELDSLKKGGNKENENARKKNPKKPKKTPPLTFDLEGFKVYIGKNNVQNDEVTFNVAEGGDLWLHTKTYHGSHGVIISRGKEVPVRVIERVAEVVAYYSEARENPKVEVDYTARKNVKKLGKIGLVNYVNYKTIVVSPKDYKF